MPSASPCSVSYAPLSLRLKKALLFVNIFHNRFAFACNISYICIRGKRHHAFPFSYHLADETMNEAKSFSIQAILHREMGHFAR